MESKRGEVSAKNIGALILAAGESKRMGSPKPLLMWKKHNFINTIIKIAEDCHLDPIVVVTGFEAEKVEKQIDVGLTTQIVRNNNWISGQGTSIAAGILEIGNKCDAVIIFLVDQPQISKEVVLNLINTYIETKFPIVITNVGEKLSPPTLLDKKCFIRLSQLKGDEGARKLLSEFNYVKCNANDPSILIDIDTPEVYKEIVRKYL